MLLLNVLLALAWVALTGQYTAINLLAGFMLGYVLLIPAQYRKEGTTYFRKAPLVIKFVFYFIWELIVANVRVLISVLGPLRNLRPAIVAVPLDIKSDAEITMLANMITLTPGTLSLDVSADRSVLFVHAISVDDVEQFKRETKEGFERAVQEVFA
jgi:multicomponent Na+:H+ antiporter subunit E